MLITAQERLIIVLPNQEGNGCINNYVPVANSVLIWIATWDRGRGGLLVAGSVHTYSMSLESVIPIFVIRILLIRRFNPFPYKSNYEVSTVLCNNENSCSNLLSQNSRVILILNALKRKKKRALNVKYYFCSVMSLD